MGIDLRALVRQVRLAAPTTAAMKFDRQFDTVSAYVRVEDEFGAKVRDIVGEVQAKRLTPAQAVAEFEREHLRAQADAFVLGRRSTDPKADGFSDAEADMLAARHEAQTKYFRGFVQDVQTGKGRMDYGQRADLYGKALWSSYTRGESVDWDETDTKRYIWVMDTDAEHCATCIERARVSRQKGGFRFSELATVGFPGEGTDCGVNCRCHVRPISHEEGDRMAFRPNPTPWRPAGTRPEDITTLLPSKAEVPIIEPGSEGTIPKPPAGTVPTVPAEPRGLFPTDPPDVVRPPLPPEDAVEPTVLPEIPVAPVEPPERTTPVTGFDPVTSREMFTSFVGGPTMPRPLPAAGLPSVKVSPITVAEWRGKAPDADVYDASLWTIPHVLIKPSHIYVDGDMRVYVGELLALVVGRSPTGIWSILSLLQIPHL